MAGDQQESSSIMKVQRFTDPYHRHSVSIRWAATISAGIFGLWVLLESYSLTGIAMEWRISAGVSALSLFFLSLIENVVSRPSVGEFFRRLLIGSLIATAGLFCFKFVYSQQSEWAQNMLLETGVACLFVAATELLIGAIRNAAIENERKQSEFYDEIARYVGFVFDLSWWQYYWLRDGLDHATTSGKGSTDAERNLLLLECAQRAKNLPEELNNKKALESIAGYLALEFEVLRVTSEVAKEYDLTDWEFRYLASVINTRADPERPLGDPIDLSSLRMVTENSAELIVRKRRSVARLAFWRMWDPLGAREELVERSKRLGSKDSSRILNEDISS